VCILTGDMAGMIKVWDADTDKELLTRRGNGINGVRSACFSPDGKRILTGSDDKTAKVWDIEPHKP
jgi:WD40 repeat protein